MIAVLSLTLLGFFLGMRHATDPDHVIAVSTIVSRQPTIRAALLIGSLWGVGHTLTIVAVGGAIVLFTIVIPPRLGLIDGDGRCPDADCARHVELDRDPRANPRDRPLGGGGANSLHAHLHSHGEYVHSHLSGREAGQHGHRDDQTPVAWLDRRLTASASTSFSDP